MSKFKSGDRVIITRGNSNKLGQKGVVVRVMATGSVDVQLDSYSPGNTCWFFSSSLDLEDEPRQNNLTEKQQAVLEAAIELSEAQEKFKKALDELNNNK